MQLTSVYSQRQLLHPGNAKRYAQAQDAAVKRQTIYIECISAGIMTILHHLHGRISFALLSFFPSHLRIIKSSNCFIENFSTIMNNIN